MIKKGRMFILDYFIFKEGFFLKIFIDYLYVIN